MTLPSLMLKAITNASFLYLFSTQNAVNPFNLALINIGTLNPLVNLCPSSFFIPNPLIPLSLIFLFEYLLVFCFIILAIQHQSRATASKSSFKSDFCLQSISIAILNCSTMRISFRLVGFLRHFFTCYILNSFVYQLQISCDIFERLDGRPIAMTTVMKYGHQAPTTRDNHQCKLHC